MPVTYNCQKRRFASWFYILQKIAKFIFHTDFLCLEEISCSSDNTFCGREIHCETRETFARMHQQLRNSATETPETPETELAVYKV